MIRKYRFYLLMVCVVSASLVLAFGPVVEQTLRANAQEISANKLDVFINKIVIELPETDDVIAPGGKGVTGFEYGFQKQLSRAKDFYLNPSRFVSTTVLFLYKLSEIEPSDLKKILEGIRNQETSAVFFVALNQQQNFFGAPFSVQPRSKISPTVPRIIPSGGLREGTTLAGYSAVNMVAPKRWKTIGERDSDLYIALDTPVEDMEHIILVITYDPIESENEE